jgi:hypothetical protein
MFGQLCEPPLWLPGAGAVVVRAGAVEDVVDPLLVVVLDVAALAIAAPPPAIAAVAAIVTSRGRSLRICSPPFG